MKNRPHHRSMFLRNTPFLRITDSFLWYWILARDTATYSTLRNYLVWIIWKFFTPISREARIVTVNLTSGPTVRREYPLRRRQRDDQRDLVASEPLIAFTKDQHGSGLVIPRLRAELHRTEYRWFQYLKKKNWKITKYLSEITLFELILSTYSFYHVRTIKVKGK